MAVCGFCEKMLGNDTESLSYNNYCYYSDHPQLQCTKYYH